jgi:DNA-directed RNA polymerase subunit M/transcription elongation factor TFIIS
MEICPECRCKLYEYAEEIWQSLVCWKCGHYESSSPAYKAQPSLFVNLVRDSPEYFMRKLLTTHPATPDKNTREGNTTIILVVLN